MPHQHVSHIIFILYSSFFNTWKELSTFIDDLAYFGGNFIETAHVNDTATLPIETLVNISTLLHQRNISCSFWWSNTLMDHHLAELTALFTRMPRVDSIFFPGGDGGILEWSTIKQTATALRRKHPNAGIWVSAQEINQTMLDSFVHDITTNDTIRSILGPNGGVVYGPHNRLPLTDFILRLQGISSSNVTSISTSPSLPLSPSTTLIRQYPDLAHSIDSQFQIQHWDASYAYSYGRQVVNPLPVFHSNIILSRSNSSTSSTVGVGAYSEGLNDDLNKFIWVAMAEDDTLSIHDVVQKYSHYFFGTNASIYMKNALFGLEQNWNGKIINNQKIIQETLNMLEQGMKYIPNVSTNWRATMYLRRGLMDMYVYGLKKQDVTLVNRVNDILHAGVVNQNNSICLNSVSNALLLLQQRHTNHTKTVTETDLAILYQRIALLTNNLDTQIGADVLQTQDVSLNMNTLNNTRYVSASYLESFLSNITLKTCLNDVLNSWLNWENPGIDGYYDNLGSIDPKDHMHLINRNQPNDIDPSCYDGCVIQGGSNVLLNIRPNWLRYSMVMYDNSLVLKYDDINQHGTYQWEVVLWYCWFDCEGDVIDLIVNGEPLVEHLIAPNPMKKLIFEIPKHVSETGSIEIACHRKSGLGGNGKTCQISEAWLRKTD